MLRCRTHCSPILFGADASVEIEPEQVAPAVGILAELSERYSDVVEKYPDDSALLYSNVELNNERETATGIIRLLGRSLYFNNRSTENLNDLSEALREVILNHTENDEGVKELFDSFGE